MRTKVSNAQRSRARQVSKRGNGWLPHRLTQPWKTGPATQPLKVTCQISSCRKHLILGKKSIADSQKWFGISGYTSAGKTCSPYGNTHMTVTITPCTSCTFTIHFAISQKSTNTTSHGLHNHHHPALSYLVTNTGLHLLEGGSQLSPFPTVSPRTSNSLW